MTWGIDRGLPACLLSLCGPLCELTTSGLQDLQPDYLVIISIGNGELWEYTVWYEICLGPCLLQYMSFTEAFRSALAKRNTVSHVVCNYIAKVGKRCTQCC